MKILLSDKTKNFYKGNMHCHSTLSDGHYTPEELKAMYKEKGYSFLAITDHEVFHNNSYLDDDKFITLTSAEYAIKQFPEQSTLVNYNMKVCHLNLYAKEQNNIFNICYQETADKYTPKDKRSSLLRPESDWKRVYSQEGISKIIKTANENGFFVCYNHPRWSLENYGDYSGYEGLWGVEIYNTGVNISGIYEYDINVLDDFLRDGKKIFASCGDDNHNRQSEIRDADSFGAFVMVNAEKLSYSSIVKSLLNGDFYTSTGPLIYELCTDDMKVYIKCSDAKRISLSTAGRRCESKLSKEGCLNFAEFNLKESDGYFRLDVTDEYGNHANTQAYYI